MASLTSRLISPLTCSMMGMACIWMGVGVVYVLALRLRLRKERRGKTSASWAKEETGFATSVPNTRMPLRFRNARTSSLVVRATVSSTAPASGATSAEVVEGAAGGVLPALASRPVPKKSRAGELSSPSPRQ